MSRYRSQDSKYELGCAMMKILFVLGFNNPFPGGGWTRVKLMSAYFCHERHSVTVVGTISLKGWKNSSKAMGPVRVLNLIPTIYTSSNLLNFAMTTLSSIVYSLVVLLAFQPRIVIISVPPGDVALGFYVTSLLLKRRVVFDYRDEWEDYAIYLAGTRPSKAIYKLVKKIMTAFYIKSDVVAAVTPAFIRSLKRRGVENVYFAPNGADVKTFRPLNPHERRRIRAELGLSQTDFVMVYSGRIEKYYRLDVVVNAVSSFIKKNRFGSVKLLLVGEGKDVQNVLNLTNKLGVAENIKHLGVRHDLSEVARVIACADVGIVPYDANQLWRNTWPAKFFEYCACGVPVIATAYRDSILADMIHRYKVGLAVSPMNALELKRAFEVMLYDAKFRAAAGVRARKLIEEHFSRARIASDLLKILSSLVDR